jgi:hypothetical protein
LRDHGGSAEESSGDPGEHELLHGHSLSVLCPEAINVAALIKIPILLASRKPPRPDDARPERRDVLDLAGYMGNLRPA